MPDAGQYDVSLETIEGKMKKQLDKAQPLVPPVKKSLFVNPEHHFIEKGRKKTGRVPFEKINESDEYVGPGYYYVPREFDQIGVGLQGNLITSKDTRFKTKETEGPGPGSYQDNISLWNKKTYNLLFNDNAQQENISF